MGRKEVTRRIVLWSTVVVVALVGLPPLVVMFTGNLGFQWTSREWTLMGHSLALASTVSLLTCFLGVPLGILFAKSDLPLRRLWTVLQTVPLLLPPYVDAISWSRVIPGLKGFAGSVLVLSTAFLPIVMLLTMTCARSVDPRLEEAARLSAGWIRVLRGITLPLLRPGILLGVMLVFLLSLGEFGVPAYLRYEVLPVESFTQFSAFYDFDAGTAAAVPLAMVTLALLIAEIIFLREKTYQLRPASSSPAPIRLRSHGASMAILIAIFCLATVVVPLGKLGLESCKSGVYAEAFSRAGESLGRSLFYGAIGATVLSLFGFLVGYLIQTRAVPFWRTVDSLTILLFALPSTVIGIGLIRLWNRPETNFIYATPAIIILGYLVQFTALTSRMTVATLAQIPPSMEESARIAGAGWMRRMTGIVAPLAGRGLAAGWLVAYIFCLRDVGITMIVYPSGSDTLPVRIFTLMANSPSGLVAALCMILIAATLLPLGILAALFRRRSLA